MMMTENIQVMTEIQVMTMIPMMRVKIQKKRRVKRKREMTQPNQAHYVYYVVPGIIASNKVVHLLLG